MGSVGNPYVISRCGIFNGQSSNLPHYPHTKLTTHTLPLPFHPFSVSLAYTQVHGLTLHYSLTSPPTVQTSYTSVGREMLNGCVGTGKTVATQKKKKGPHLAAASLRYFVFNPFYLPFYVFFFFPPILADATENQLPHT